MATEDEAQQAILDLIEETAKAESAAGTPNDLAAMRKHKADVILALAEARAWLLRTDQPHGR